MSDKKLQDGDLRRITVDAKYLIYKFGEGWWWADGVAISGDSPAIKSVQPIPDPPYTPQVGDLFTDGDGRVRLCIVDGLATTLTDGALVRRINSLSGPFTKVPAP